MTTLSDYYKIFRSRGVRRTIDQFFQLNLFDWVRGTDTGTWLPISEYDAEFLCEGAVHYDPVYTSVARRAFEKVYALYGDSAFDRPVFDVGCGKGKAMLVAGELGFQKLAGVELNPRLAEIAKENFSRRELEARMDIGDVSHYSGFLPHSIVFAYNPFECNIMHRVVEILTPVDDVVFIYVNPICAANFENWREVFRVESDDSHRRFRIYSNAR